jgi:quinol monooxygenase YgiN
MYGMSGKFVAQAGKRDQFVKILTQAAGIVGQMPGCHLYVVSKDLADEVTIWVIEIWDDKEAHDASLQDRQVRSLIQEAMPLMAGPPAGSELNVVGGHGLVIK